MSCAESENGIFYMDVNGNPTFKNRNHRNLYPYTVSQATFGDGVGELPYTKLIPSFDRDQVTNDWTVTLPGQTDQEVTILGRRVELEADINLVQCAALASGFQVPIDV